MGLFGQGCQMLSEHRDHKTKMCCPAALWDCQGFAPASAHAGTGCHVGHSQGCKSVQVICHPHVALTLVFQGQFLMTLQGTNTQGGPVASCSRISLSRVVGQGGKAVGCVLPTPLCPHQDGLM